MLFVFNADAAFGIPNSELGRSIAARWARLQARARQPTIGEVAGEANAVVERENLWGKLCVAGELR